MFVKTENGLQELPMDKATYLKLFAPVERYTTQQSIGDCYLVSVLSATMQNPKTRAGLYQMFQQQGKDIIVTLKDAKDMPIIFKDCQISSDTHLKGCLAHQMLEEAYMRVKAQKYQLPEEMSMIEFGLPEKAANAFIDNPKQNTYCNETAIRLLLNNLNFKKVEKITRKLNNEKLSKLSLKLHTTPDGLKRILGELGEHQKKQKGDFAQILADKSQDALCFLGTKKKPQTKGLHGNHAYTVVAVDKEKGLVSVTEPNNPSKIKQIPFSELEKSFMMLTVVSENPSAKTAQQVQNLAKDKLISELRETRDDLGLSYNLDVIKQYTEEEITSTLHLYDTFKNAFKEHNCGQQMSFLSVLENLDNYKQYGSQVLDLLPDFKIPQNTEALAWDPYTSWESLSVEDKNACFELFKKALSLDDAKINELKSMQHPNYEIHNLYMESLRAYQTRQHNIDSMLHLLNSNTQNFDYKQVSVTHSDAEHKKYIDFYLRNHDSINQNMLETILITPFEQVEKAQAFINSLPKEAQQRWDIKHALLFQKYQKYNSLEELPLDMKNQLMLDLVTAVDYTTDCKFANEIKILPKTIDEWVDMMDKLKQEVQPVSKKLSPTETAENNAIFSAITEGNISEKDITTLFSKLNLSQNNAELPRKLAQVAAMDEFKKLPPNDKKVLIIATMLSDLQESPLTSVHRAKGFDLTPVEFQKLHSILKHQNLYQEISDIQTNVPASDMQLFWKKHNPTSYAYNAIESDLLNANSMIMADILTKVNSKNASKKSVDVVETMKQDIQAKMGQTTQTNFEYTESEIRNINGVDFKVIKASNLKDFLGYVHTTEGEMGTSGGNAFCPNPIHGKGLDNRMKVNLINSFETITHNNLISVGTVNILGSGNKFLLAADYGNALCTLCGGTRRGNKLIAINNAGNGSITQEMFPGSEQCGQEQLVSNPHILAFVTDNLETLAPEYVDIIKKLNIPVVLSNE